MSKGKARQDQTQSVLSAAASQNSSLSSSSPPALLSNPATGSANPSASFSALWAYLLPALNHIMRSPNNDPHQKTPSLDVGYYSGIHTAVYNYFNFQNEMATYSNPTPTPEKAGTGNRVESALSGSDLYNQLDSFFEEVCRDILLSAPPIPPPSPPNSDDHDLDNSDGDSTTLLHYLLPAFTRYANSSQSVSRLLQYVNRHYVKRAVDDDRGWLRLNDVLSSVVKSLSTPPPPASKKFAAVPNVSSTKESLSLKLKERKITELKAWGYDPENDRNASGGLSAAATSTISGTGDHHRVTLSEAESYAEAASSPDRIIPIASLAMRQFRLQVINPLLAIPKSQSKSKSKSKAAKAKAKAKSKAKAKQKSTSSNDTPLSPPTASSSGPVHSPTPPPPSPSPPPSSVVPGPKGRLARAVKWLLESDDISDEAMRRATAIDLLTLLRRVGIRSDHVLCKKLDKYISTGSDE